MSGKANGTMTRQAVKASLVALSLAATLASWAILARVENRRLENSGSQSVVLEPVVQVIDLPPIPTLVRPSGTGGAGTMGVPGVTPLDLPSIPGVSAPALPPIPAVRAPAAPPRSIARTRSSR